MDGDCPSQHACIDQRCQNPCIVRNPCSGAQKCVVTDSLPIRTVGCVCPDGSVAGPQGECVRGKCESITICVLIFCIHIYQTLVRLYNPNIYIFQLPQPQNVLDMKTVEIQKFVILGLV